MENSPRGHARPPLNRRSADRLQQWHYAQVAGLRGGWHNGVSAAHFERLRTDMHELQPLHRVIDLLDPQQNQLWNVTPEQAYAAVASGNPVSVRQIEGPFAIVARDGATVRMARSLGRPMRYFLAKQAAGPCLIVAERIDELHAELARMGLDSQFHPSYSRMVPAHHVTEIQLVGCPDPNPRYRRFVAPARNRLPADPGSIGAAYIGQLQASCRDWLGQVPEREPIGVLFSGGIDSGSVLLVLHQLLLERGTPQRLKAFTLAVDGQAEDSRQAAEFLRSVGLDYLLEVIDVPSSRIDWREAVRVLEDYKPLDVEAALMGLALCRGIRERYPQWRYLVDGDGGDENLKDYPIEENPELTIRSVLNNLMLYQEGWGVDAIKHSLTYSGGQSRGHVRSSAPARHLGFVGFSPYALPSVIEVAEGIPFIELTGWQHDRLYALKGQVVGAGVESVTGMRMPTYPKRRFQHGVANDAQRAALFAARAAEYRRYWHEIWTAA
jgi:asparagine synthase (glutamine-hydrolysing)